MSIIDKDDSLPERIFGIGLFVFMCMGMVYIAGLMVAFSMHVLIGWP